MATANTEETQTMQMFWSSRSPFARYAMLAAHELGIAERIEKMPTHVTGMEPLPEVEPHNPIGRIPTLVLPDGTAIHDSRVIVEYFDAIYGNNQLLPLDFKLRLDVLTRVSTGQAMIEKGVRWIGERFRAKEQQNPEFQAYLAHSLNKSLDALEQSTSGWATKPLDAGHLAIGNMLGYLDFRFNELKWREQRPQLAAWHETFKARPSYLATEFVDTSGLTITKVDESAD